MESIKAGFQYMSYFYYTIIPNWKYRLNIACDEYPWKNYNSCTREMKVSILKFNIILFKYTDLPSSY